MADAKVAFETWAVVELMGHVRLAGRLTEENLFGSALGRIDIPVGDGTDEFITQYFGGGSVYRITPSAKRLPGRWLATPVLHPSIGLN